MQGDKGGVLGADLNCVGDETRLELARSGRDLGCTNRLKGWQKAIAVKAGSLTSQSGASLLGLFASAAVTCAFVLLLWGSETAR
jgi:hypothetical protein